MHMLPNMRALLPRMNISVHFFLLYPVVRRDGAVARKSRRVQPPLESIEV